VTDGQRPDRQAGEKLGTMSVFGRANRLEGEQPTSLREGDLLKYALLVYNDSELVDRTPDEQRDRIKSGMVDVLERPNVSGWLQLQDVESATTVRYEPGRTLLTDGPFVDSKDFLGGFIVVEAENLDGALDVAGELQQLRGGGAIEIRPVQVDALIGA
jgi:hypothetical protein